MDTLRHLEVISASSSRSRGVFANSATSAGAAICSITFDRILRIPSRHTVQIGMDAHVQPLPAELQLVNHGCEPNVFFDTKTMVLRALRNIQASEELRYFYPSTEWEMAEPFECFCGARSCLRLIEGASRLSADVLQRYELAPHIREMRSFC
jgi:hypothetical protein